MDIGNMPMYPIFNALMFIGVILIGWIILRFLRRYSVAYCIYRFGKMIGGAKQSFTRGVEDGSAGHRWD